MTHWLIFSVFVQFQPLRVSFTLKSHFEENDINVATFPFMVSSKTAAADGDTKRLFLEYLASRWISCVHQIAHGYRPTFSLQSHRIWRRWVLPFGYKSIKIVEEKRKFKIKLSPSLVNGAASCLYNPKGEDQPHKCFIAFYLLGLCGFQNSCRKSCHKNLVGSNNPAAPTMFL